MERILVDVGVHTQLEVDLSDFDFNGIKKVIMTGKNASGGDVIFERDFSKPDKYIISIKPAESQKIDDTGEYDFDIITTDDKRYKITDNGKIVLRRGCGQCSE